MCGWKKEKNLLKHLKTSENTDHVAREQAKHFKSRHGEHLERSRWVPDESVKVKLGSIRSLAVFKIKNLIL
ncbi:unnamed protein product [Nippostrongylus brasiliensis]|uniref:Ovule protein n=1 Tax=Nippostrongylus brasiliensis TaxID=27835 RepID=A0A0N4XWL4_NIPBR|nr:unnamed protein product [Nippostrongylus brasiliensis]